MVGIELTQGYFAMVDDEDYEYLCNYNWHIQKDGYMIYATTHFGTTKRRMHQVIMNDINIDHIDRNGLNNQKSNLRKCTHSQNMANKLIQSNNTSGFKGVHFRKDKFKWTAEIKCNGKKYRLGYFDNPVLASIAYDKKAKELFGEFAWANI